MDFRLTHILVYPGIFSQLMWKRYMWKPWRYSDLNFKSILFLILRDSVLSRICVVRWGVTTKHNVLSVWSLILSHNYTYTFGALWHPLHQSQQQSNPLTQIHKNYRNQNFPRSKSKEAVKRKDLASKRSFRVVT